LKKDALILVSTAGPSVAEQASWCLDSGRVHGFGVVVTTLFADAKPVVEWVRPLAAEVGQQALLDDLVDRVADTLGWTLVPMRDGAGGLTQRVIVMILNEAAEVIREGTASVADVDMGMKLGANYPYGPVEWMDALGLHSVLATLEALHREFGEDRYRPSPLLRQLIWSGRSIRPVLIPKGAQPLI